MVKEALLIAAGAITVVAIIAIVRYQMSKKESGEDVERIFVDELNIGEIKKWFVDKLTDDNKKGVIFYPTEENTEKWKVKMPENKNQLIQIVYDVDADKVVEYREIAFTELSEKLKALLDENNGTLVIDK